MSLRSRLHDYLHERRIRRLYRAYLGDVRLGTPIEQRRRLWVQFQQAVAERSPEAVRRLEKKRGLA